MKWIGYDCAVSYKISNKEQTHSKENWSNHVHLYEHANKAL